MRLSGVDPGIIRELSGIYKPFIKAFKELISNAHDADAKQITVSLSDDMSSMEVHDDGLGMTPYEFHRDFARLGGSTAWLQRGTSPGGRRKIGYKGIGFLAVARYCSGLHIETRADRPFRSRKIVTRRNRKILPLHELVDPVVPLNLIRGRVKIRGVRGILNAEKTILKRGSDYLNDARGIRLISRKALKARKHQIEYEVDCSHIILRAALDFDYLLGLEHRADLQALEDFCEIQLNETKSPSLQAYTNVRLRGLKDFVVRELAAPRVKGKARNIVFKSGKEQFLWRLARSSSIADDIPAMVPPCPMLESARLQAETDLPEVQVKWQSEPTTNIEARRVCTEGNTDSVSGCVYTSQYPTRRSWCERVHHRFQRSHIPSGATGNLCSCPQLRDR